MKLGKAMRAVAASMLLGFGSIDAGAAMITYTVSGTLDWSTFSTVQIGDSFTMTYTVDTSQPPSSWFSIPPTTLADFNSVSNATMQAGIFSASASTGMLRQIDDPNGDTYRVDASPVAQLEGLDLVYFTLDLFDPSGTAIADALTALTDPLGAFSGGVFWAVFASGEQSGSMRAILSFSVVPEPATPAVLAVGLVSLAWIRRRGLVKR